MKANVGGGADSNRAVGWGVGAMSTYRGQAPGETEENGGADDGFQPCGL